MPTVTVAIPTYNRASLVTEALESVFAQTYDDYEVIVIDNGSADGTRDVLDPYLDRIRYVYQENQGRAGARNAAIRLARGRLIAFLDSDDVWLPDKLERQAPVFEADERVGLVHGHVEVIDREGRPLTARTSFHHKLFSEANSRPATYAGYALECRCLTSTVMIRTACFERVGLYDTTSGLEDVDLYLRLVLEYEIVFLEGQPLARYRCHESQTGNHELVVGQIELCRKHLALLETTPGIPEAQLARRNFHLLLGTSSYMVSDSAGARRSLLRAISLDPSLLTSPRVLRRLVLACLPRTARDSLKRLRRLVRKAAAPDLPLVAKERAWRR